jgi:hypothetical protein
MHTPGPWTIYNHTKGIDIIFDDGEDGKTIATVRTAADAALIAAAPDLLEALQLAYRHLNGGSDSLTPMEFAKAFKMARAAIAKALGE